MLFHSLEFALLFLITAPFAVWAPSRVRRIVLLVASYAFYAWFSIPLVSLMVFSSVLDFSLGHRMHGEPDQRRRRRYLLASLIGNLGLLFAFKYTNWFLGSLNSLSAIWTNQPPFPHLDIILPLGISFYTFQTLSYTIDIYRGKLTPTRSLLDFALFVSFFPQLVAGPIVRAAHLLPQIRSGPKWEPRQVEWGLGLFLYGLVKKVVLADNFALIANTVYGDPTQYSGIYTLLGTYAFAFQIYCDFSGYTDMARGLAGVLGYDIGLNFNFPYFSVGIVDFWRRWHISLSTWLRDYLYIPLGGNRGSANRTHINVLLTMLLGGLWHGANWTFVAWGALHGIWITVEHIAIERGAKLGNDVTSVWRRLIGTLVTFHIVCLTWVFFRAESIPDAWAIIGGMFAPAGSVSLDLSVFGLLAPFLAVELTMWKTSTTSRLLSRPVAFWCAILVGVILVLVLGDFRGSDFVYFQF